MEPHEVDTILRALAATMEHQRSINADLRTCLQEQREFNKQQLAINTDVHTTLARIETLLARLMPQGDNGRDA